MNFKILPYMKGSRSARALANALVCKVLRLEGSKYVGKTGDVVINWGNSTPSSYGESTILNPSIGEVTDKRKFFQKLLHDSPEIIPPFWLPEYLEDGQLPPEAFPVVCRTILNGHSGAGIIIADTPDDLVDAALYVKYVKKKKEFRIHVGRTAKIQDNEDGALFIYTIIAEQQKVRKNGIEPTDWRVRSHSNGFVFKRQGIDVPMVVRNAAVSCLAATGLDFGAVDVILTSGGQAFVLEVNTAPGLEGQTVQDYANYFKDNYYAQT